MALLASCSKGHDRQVWTGVDSPAHEEDRQLVGVPARRYVLQRSVAQSWPREARGVHSFRSSDRKRSAVWAGAQFEVIIQGRCRKTSGSALRTKRRLRPKPTQQQVHVMGSLSGRRRKWGLGKRSIARTSYRRKAPRIVSTSCPFTGVRSMRSRLERTPRRSPERAARRSGRATGVSDGSMGSSTRNESIPRIERCVIRPKRVGRRETSAPPASPRR